MKKLIFYTFSFLSFQALLVFLALFNPSKELSPFVSGYFVHLIAVFASVLLLYATLTHDFVSMHHPLLISLAYGLLISVSGEVVQLFITYRSFDYLDMLAGVIATACAGLFLWIRKDWIGN